VNPGLTRIKLSWIAVAVAASAQVASASPITNASITGLGTTMVTATAQADYATCGTMCDDPPSISAMATVTGFTLGPVRDGQILMFITGHDSSFGTSGGIVGPYSFACSGVGCVGIDDAPRPFTLGVPFEIQVSASALLFGQSSGTGDIDFQFALFEMGTAPPTTSFPFPSGNVVIYSETAVPEPATWLLTAVGLLWRRGRTHPISLAKSK